MGALSRTGLFCLALWGASGMAAQAGMPSRDLIAVATAAPEENRWRVPAGIHRGRFRIDREGAEVICEPGAVLDAEGHGNGLTIAATKVRVSDCTLRNWGKDLTAMDAGVFIEKGATGTTLRNNQLSGPGFGVWVDGTAKVTISGNRIRGDTSLRSQDRGNGIHLYAVTGARVTGNQVRETRDGIYIDTSNGNRLEGNVLEDLRYGIHYMFSHDNKVVGNITRRTRTGYALMQSRALWVEGNCSEEDQNYGILMNYITYSTLRGNRIHGVRRGATGDAMISGAEGKALFVYNSLYNDITDNRFEQSTLGIHLTAGSEDNQLSGNRFIGNQQQVKYVATRTQEWSRQGRGNYWSDYLGWDRDGDGIGDVPYQPNDDLDRLLWLYPQARLLMSSPSVSLLRWAQSAFPVTRSPGVRDSHPLMTVGETAVEICHDSD